MAGGQTKAQAPNRRFLELSASVFSWSGSTSSNQSFCLVSRTRFQAGRRSEQAILRQAEIQRTSTGIVGSIRISAQNHVVNAIVMDRTSKTPVAEARAIENSQEDQLRSEQPRQAEAHNGTGSTSDRSQSQHCFNTRLVTINVVAEAPISPSKPCRIAPCAATLSRHQDGTEMSLFQCQPTHDRRLHTRYRADCPRSE